MKDRTLALAGLMQSVQLVQQMAQTGEAETQVLAAADAQFELGGVGLRVLVARAGEVVVLNCRDGRIVSALAASPLPIPAVPTDDCAHT